MFQTGKPGPTADRRSYDLNAVHEQTPGPKWQAAFERLWPQYKAWFLSEGQQARPGYMTSSKQLRACMPELMPVYEQLTELAGNGDLAARFLSFYRPPPYLLSCSQALWTRQKPVLVRNYDYSPELFEWTVLYSNWLRPVIAMSDCLWGVLDGMNDAGLAVSLAFGGNKQVGDGFGVPLVLRYILETCDDVKQARRALKAIPIHMAYNIAMLDRSGAAVTVYLTPGRKPRFVRTAVSTNHQDRIEWQAYARMSASIERRAFLESRLTMPGETRQAFLNCFLKPPIHRTNYARAFGTLYTASYHPTEGTVGYHWPNRSSVYQSFDDFRESRERVELVQPVAQQPDVYRTG